MAPPSANRLLAPRCRLDSRSTCCLFICPKAYNYGCRNHSYTWLDEEQKPVELPAHECITHLQRWISAKINNIAIFPTDPSDISSAFDPRYSVNPCLGDERWLGIRSGFPEQFAITCKVIFRQMFRIYAHLYWSHFIDPFFHLCLEKQLNSCFSHFLLTAISLDMLERHEVEPMQDLINLWVADGTFPAESKAYVYGDLERGQFLLRLGAGR